MSKKFPLGDLKPGLKEREIYPTPYLRSEDFEEERTLTIKRIVGEEVKDNKGRSTECIVLYFKEDEVPMVLNKTNYKVIKKIHNLSDPTEIVGKKVTFYAKDGIRNPSTGEIGSAIRVRPQVPKKDTLNAQRFEKMVESIKANKFDKIDALDRFELTETQRKEISKL